MFLLDRVKYSIAKKGRKGIFIKKIGANSPSISVSENAAIFRRRRKILFSMNILETTIFYVLNENSQSIEYM